MAPILIGDSIINVNVTVDRILSSHLTPGQLTILNVANKLGMLPMSLIAMSLSSLLYPHVINLMLAKRLAELRRLVFDGLMMLWFLAWQIAAVFCMLGPPIIALCFGHGRFTAADVRAASAPLAIYGLGMPWYLTIPFCMRLFFARQQSGRILRISIAAALLNVASSILLVRIWSIVGLVVANAFSQTVWAIGVTRTLARLLQCRWVELATAFTATSLPALIGWILPVLLHYAVIPAPASLWGQVAEMAGILVVEAALLMGYTLRYPTHPLPALVRRLIPSHWFPAKAAARLILPSSKA